MEIVINHLKYSMSYDDRIKITVHVFPDFYQCTFFDRSQLKRFKCRIMREYYPDIYRLLPKLKDIINDNFDVSC